MLGTEVAAVDGNLEEPGAGHRATGRRRSLVLVNLGCSAWCRRKFREANILKPPSSGPQHVHRLRGEHRKMKQPSIPSRE